MATTTFPLERADDGLTLQVDLIDLTPTVTPTGWQVTRDPTSTGAAIAVTFPPQHVVEYADAANGTPAPVQAAPILSPGSRVVFTVPAGTPAFPLTVAGVLDAVSRLPLHGGPGSAPLDPVPDAVAAAGVTADGGFRSGGTVASRRRLADARALADAPAPVARSAAAPVAEALAAVAPTSVVAPARLELAIPSGAARFAHAAEPAEHDGVVEQWHTRLAVATTSGDGRTVEAGGPVVARSYVESTIAFPDTPAKKSYTDTVVEALINSPLSQDNAERVVFNTKRAPLDLRHLALSPAGASLDMEQSWDRQEGTWSGQADPTLLAYRHRVDWGRDSEVRTVRRGRLLPFGHAAILTETTQRLPRSAADGSAPALRTRAVLTIREKVREFGAGGVAGRAWPWARVVALTSKSPGGELVPGPAHGHLNIGVAGTDVPFEVHFRATDRAGNDVEFSLPVLFAETTVSDTVARGAWAAKPASFRSLELGGAPVVVAPPGAASAVAGGADTTTLVTSEAAMVLDAAGLPKVTSFLGSSPVLDGLAGPVQSTFTWASAYVTEGFGGNNPGELLLDLVPTDPAVSTAVDLAARASALARVGLAPVRSLSRAIGAVAVADGTPQEVAARLAQVALNKFDPQAWLGNLPADLFGVFPIRELLELPRQAQTLAAAPRQLAEQVDGRRTFSSSWDVDLVPAGQHYQPPGIPLVRLVPAAGQAVALHIDAVTTVDPLSQSVRASSTSTVRGAVLEFVPLDGGEHLVTLPVDQITFEATDSAAPTVDVDMGTVTFGGPLAYVKALADLLDSTGFAKPGARSGTGGASAGGASAVAADETPSGPSLDVLDDRVRAGLAIAIPDVAVGIFALRDMAFASRFEVFFDGRPPRLELDFATIENPFRLTVSAIGGGGHLAVRLSATDLELVAGALEFGASVSVNLAGIAKGSASVMGGVYFELTEAGLTLTGYLDLRGKLEILSIISLSIAVTLSLSYVEATDKVEGRAELVVKVKVLFFKKTVRFEVHRQFAGSNADPTFAELMAPADWPAGEPLPWDTYCTAFAAAA